MLTGHPLGSSLDPTDVDNRALIAIESDLVVRSLTQFVYDPKAGRMVLAPDLATNLGTPNRRMTAWTFTLRRSVRFANGRPITPRDLKFAIERSFDRSTFPEGPSYSNAYFLHGQTYDGPYSSAVPYDGVVIHRRNLTVKMAQPFHDLPYWMALPAMSPIPPGEASNPTTYRLHPWASGPYKIASYTPGRSLVLVRNRDWDPTTDPGRHQYVKRFLFDFHTPIDSKVTQALLSDTGSARTTLLMSDLSPHGYAAFEAQAPGRLVTGSTPCTELLYPDNRAIANVEVRRALALAYPYRAAWAAGQANAGLTRITAWNSLPPGFPGRLQYNPIPGHVPGTSDPAKAKALLTQAGALHDTITFSYDPTVPTSVAAKNAVADALARAGFRPRPLPVAGSTQSGVRDLQGRRLNVRSGTWCSDWPSSGLWVTELFGSPSVQPVGIENGNVEHFSNAGIDNRIRTDSLMPVQIQPAAGAALEKRIMQKYLPVIPLGYVTATLAHGSAVHGVGIDSVRGEPTLENLWVGAG